MSRRVSRIAPLPASRRTTGESGRSVLFVPFTFRPGGNRRLASGGNIPAGLPEPGVSLKGYHTAELVGKACEDGEITLAVPVNGKDFSPYSTVEAGVCGAQSFPEG